MRRLGCIVLLVWFGLCPVLIVCAQVSKSDLVLYEAHRQMQLGNNSEAFQLLSHSLELNPHSAAALSMMSDYQHFLRNDSLALHYALRATQESPDNYFYQQSLVSLYINARRTDEAIEVLERMASRQPVRTDVLYMLESLYREKADYQGMVRVLDMLERKEGKSEQLSMEKYRTYVQMKDQQQAFREMSELAAEFPNDVRYKVLIGDLYLDQDQPDEALRRYREVEQTDPDNVTLMASMLNYYSRTGQDSLYQQQIEYISTNPQLDADTRLRFLTTLVYMDLQHDNDSTRVVRVFDKVMQMPQFDERVAELYASYMVTREMPSEQVKPVMNQILQINPENEKARLQLLTYAIEEEDTMGIVDVCRPALHYHSTNLLLYYYLGIAYFQLDSTQLALDTFREGLRRSEVRSNIELIANMYALMGDCYHDLGDMRHAYEAYDSCLLYRPDEPLVLNNYAYYLSLEGKRLDKASEMSLRSLQKENDNPTYVDTYAWILFRQKKYKEAKQQIDRAITLMGDSIDASDANIVEHAGDIYAKNGLIDDAVRYWQQSQSLGNDSALLEKKIRKRKYIAY